MVKKINPMLVIGLLVVAVFLINQAGFFTTYQVSSITCDTWFNNQKAAGNIPETATIDEIFCWHKAPGQDRWVIDIGTEDSSVSNTGKKCVLQYITATMDSRNGGCDPNKLPEEEEITDTDGDGIVDALDTDDDGDGIPDAEEVPEWLMLTLLIGGVIVIILLSRR